MYEADEIGSGFHAGLGAISGLVVASMLQSRQDAAATRQVRAARCARAAAGARAGVLQDTVADLRERLADAVADADDLGDLVRQLQAQVASLTADRLVLANALQATRRAA